MHSALKNALRRTVPGRWLTSYSLVTIRTFSVGEEFSRTLVRKIRSPSTDEQISYQDLSNACELIPKLGKKRELAEALLNRLKSMISTVDISDVIGFLERIYSVQQIRGIPTITNEIREIATSLSSRGLSSFSLDQFAEYVEFCRKIRVNMDAVFVQNMCERIAAIVVESTDEQAQLASYIIRVNRSLSNPALSKRLQNIPPLALQDLSLCDLQDILSQLSDDPEATEFIASTRKAAVTILKNRPVSDILSELCSQRLSSSDDIFRAGLSLCESRTEIDSLSPNIASLFIRAWGRQRTVCEKFSLQESFDKIMGVALTEEAELARNLQSFARLENVETPTQIVIDAVLSRGVNFSPDDLISIVESTTVLRLRSADLVGVILSNIDAFLCNTDYVQDTSLWKFAVWWQAVRNSLPYNSMFVDILKKEFPETVRLLSECPSEEFVQQVRPRTWYAKTIESVSNHLKNHGIQYDLFPQIDSTPLRTHFRVLLNNEMFYVILMKSETEIQQVSSDARVSEVLVKEFAETHKLKIAFVKSEELMEPTLLDPISVIRRHIETS